LYFVFEMESYDTLIEAINALRTQGYTEDFNLRSNCLECSDGIKIYQDEFKIDKFFRFEDNTSPSDQSILYAISSPVHNRMGVLVNAYGVYSDSIASEMLSRLLV
jgi:hypothetical protein